MFNLKYQNNKWNQMLRQRKYRPSVLGFSVHVDWYFLFIVFVGAFIIISICALNWHFKITALVEKDFADEVVVEPSAKIEIDKFNQILKRVESK